MALNFCPNCAAPFPAAEKVKVHPHCEACGVTNWRNPRTVAVLLQPVRAADGRVGLVVLRRGIEPFRGEMALPGGFVEFGESVEEAAARELREESRLETPPELITMINTVPTQAGHMLAFCTTEYVLEDFTDIPFEPTTEALGLGVIYSPQDLCFPLHSRATREWFKWKG